MDGHFTLHGARVKRNIGLDELNARTSLSPVVLRKIDEGRFDELPPGVYARAYVKSFAAEVGLDPDEALRSIEHLLPGAPDPLPVLRELQPPGFSERFSAKCAAIVRGVKKRADMDTDAKPDEVQVEDTSMPRIGAAAIDALVLIVLNLAVVLLVALGTGIRPSSLLRHGSGALGMLCAVPTVLYFILFNGIAGQTVGRRLCRLPEAHVHAPLTLDAILRRAVAPGSQPDTQGEGLSRPAFVSRG
jgi:hypothetical protein